MKLARTTIQREPSIRKVDVERFSLTSSNSFDQVVAALNAAIGHPDIKEFWESAHAKSVTELEAMVQKSVGNAGLMLFVEFDHGAIVRKETGQEAPRILRFVIGKMARRVPDAGSYAPVTVLVDERADGVHLSYDRMASILKPYGNAEELQVARDLDARVEALFASAAA
jgi:hypothetical protein